MTVRFAVNVTPREGRVSRNLYTTTKIRIVFVTPREGRVSRNENDAVKRQINQVTPREGRVSRNAWLDYGEEEGNKSRPARGV